MEVFKGEADGFLNAAKEERASLLASPSGGDKTVGLRPRVLRVGTTLTSCVWPVTRVWRD